MIKRREPRIPFKASIRYMVEDPLPTDENGIAVTSDRSTRGLGLFVEQGFAVGQRMKIFSPQLSEEPLTAQVRWCNEISDSLFRIGLSLV